MTGGQRRPSSTSPLEVEGALEYVRKMVESGPGPGSAATPGESGTPPAAGASTRRSINTVIPLEESTVKPDPKKVFIIHGRNVEARKEMGVFVRSLGLAPINFSDVRSAMGGTPTVADIVERGMNEAQGIIALITADEYSAVRPEYRYDHDEPDQIARWQARPNVLFEAGMAFGRDRNRVVFVLLGNPKLFTDVAGVHVLRPTNDPSGDRVILRGTLAQGMACDVEPHSTDWMTAGDFVGCVANDVGAVPQDPFVGPTTTAEHAADADGSPLFGLTRDAQSIVEWLTEQYLDAGYPSHRGWSFSPGAEQRTTFAELRAHGLIKTMGSGGRNWVLTDAGHALLMALISAKRA